jgi:hypothetical protein
VINGNDKWKMFCLLPSAFCLLLLLPSP